MSLSSALLALGVVGFVLWRGRRIPLSGRRKQAVIGCQAAAVGALCLALWGAPHRRVQEVPRRVVYLVDGSASIDVSQRDWIVRRIASLESRRPAQLARAVMAFGLDAQVVIPPGHDPLTSPEALQAAFARAPVDPQQTHLEAALLSSVSAMPPQAGGAVILFSDGRETAGNVTGTLPYLRRLGLEVFPEPVPVFGPAKTAWEGLSLPPLVQRGSPVAIRLVVFNAAPRSKAGAITVALQGVPVKRQRVTVPPGWQVLTVSVPAIGRGTMALDVHFTIPADGLSEHRAAYTEVEGPPQVLLVQERTAALPALAAALKRREMEVTVVRPQELPSDAGRLLDYDAVLFFNLPKSIVSAEQAQALRSYVQTYGGGLVTVGLGGELSYELQQASPLDALLPVRFEPKGLQEAKRRVCILLLIDRSASMLGPRIAATKRAAVELVKQLAPEDLIGILAFDTQPYVLAEVQQAGQIGQSLVEKLARLRSTGGTDIYPALTASVNRLQLTDAAVKHVILLSDGNTPYHAKAYDALIDELKRDGITVSTIGIGAAFINTDYLQWLAGATGGTFYSMSNFNELPKLVVRDTEQALGRLPFTEGYFRPAREPTTDWFSDEDEWPPLRGYFTATAQAGARVDLTVKGGDVDDPLLARWSLGQGRVVSFTSDADLRWSPDWIRWPGFEGTWAQVVRWAMRPRLTEALFVRVDERQSAPQLIVEGALSDPRAELVAAEETAGRIPLALAQTGAWRWQAALDHVPSGWYQLVLESRQPGAGPVFAKRWVQVGTPPSAAELPGQPPQESLLRRIADATQGAYQAPDAAFIPLTTTATTFQPPLMRWLPFVVLLFLAGVALRGGSML